MKSKLQNSKRFRLFLLARAIFMFVLLLTISGCECCLEFGNESGGEFVGDFEANNQAATDTGGSADGSMSGDSDNQDGEDAQIGSGEHESEGEDSGGLEDVVEDVFESEDAAVGPDKDTGMVVDVGPVEPLEGECNNVYGIEILALVNAARAENGKRGLQCDPLLTRSARLHAEDMCAQNYFSHTSKDGRSMGDRIRAEGVQYRAIGENIAKGQSSSLAAHTSWMNSPGHRANILSDKYDRLGVGHAQCASGRYWVQNFAG